jgi:outer membrane assembly lipoprotein YfiO
MGSLSGKKKLPDPSKFFNQHDAFVMREAGYTFKLLQSGKKCRAGLEPMLGENRGNKAMAYMFRVFFLCCLLLFCLGCAPKSAKLQRSIVPPDQDLFETGTNFLSRGNYIRARLTLQTMINTYPDSEMTADAYFAVADTYFEEGGITNWLQAEQQYKDFIVFFPANPKAPDAQMKIIALQRKMVGAPDRDNTPAKRGEQEALKFLDMYPDHPFVPIVRQELAFFQDNLAEGEFGTAAFYAKRDNYAAAVGRWKTILDSYPNFYKTPEVLYKMAEAYETDKLPDMAEEYLDRIVSQYPFSDFAESAKNMLVTMGKPIPKVDTELADLNKSKMRTPEGFSPLKPLDDFVKAIGFKGPPDAYEQAKEAVAQEKAKAETAAKESKAGGEEGINIEDVIQK